MKKAMRILSLGSAFVIGLLCRDLSAQDTSVMPSPPSDKARLIVMRVKQGLGKDAEAALLQINGGVPEFRSLLGQGEKVIIEVPSGKQEFLTLGYAKPPTGGYVTAGGDMLFADLLGGKTYYVVLRYSVGTGGFIPVPVRADRKYKVDSREVVEGISSYRIVREDSASNEQFARERNWGRVQEEYGRVKTIYERKSADKVAERTIRPEDSAN